MAASYPFTIVTPLGRVFQGPVESIVVPGERGYFGVLRGHAPMIAATRNGTLTLRTEEEGEKRLSIGPGVLEVIDGSVTLLTEMADLDSV